MAMIQSSILCIFIITAIHISGSSSLFTQQSPDAIFPLSFETPAHLVTMFAPGGYIYEQCSKVAPTSTVDAVTAAGECSQRSMQSGNPVAMLEDMPNCLRERTREIGNKCNLEKEEQEFFEQALKNNEIVSNGMAEFLKVHLMDTSLQQAMPCIGASQDELRVCSTSNKKGNMRYDEEGCSALERYTECSFEATNNCHEGLAIMQRNLLEEVRLLSCQNVSAGNDTTSVIDLLEERGEEEDGDSEEGGEDGDSEEREEEAVNLQKETNSILLRILTELKEQTEILKEKEDKD